MADLKARSNALPVQHTLHRFSQPFIIRAMLPPIAPSRLAKQHIAMQGCV